MRRDDSDGLSRVSEQSNARRGCRVPIYEYQAQSEQQSCPHCVSPFEVIQRLSDPPLTRCPQCGAPVAKQISAPAVGSSKSNLDDRAKHAGFHKLQRLGKGEYEKKY